MNKIELDQFIKGVAQLETADLEQVVEQVNLILAQRKVASLSQSEAELLQRINQRLPESTQRRYNELRTKLETETMTPEEHQELLALVDIVEQVDAERLQHLIELSQLRQVALNDLIHQLSIRPPAVHA